MAGRHKSGDGGISAIDARTSPSSMGSESAGRFSAQPPSSSRTAASLYPVSHIDQTWHSTSTKPKQSSGVGQFMRKFVGRDQVNEPAKRLVIHTTRPSLRKSHENRETSTKSAPSTAGLVIKLNPALHPLLVKPRARDEDELRSKSQTLRSQSSQSHRKGKEPEGQQHSDSEANLSEWVKYLLDYAAGKYDLSQPPDPPAQRPIGHFAPPPSPQEKERIVALQGYRVASPIDTPLVDSVSPAQFDRFQKIVLVTRKLFNMKVCLLSLLDDKKQYFKCEVGLNSVGLDQMRDITRDLTFCAHTILTNEPIVIMDAQQDWRLCNHPLVQGPPHVRFYAGAPIVTPDGHAIGTICILDQKPRTTFSASQKRRLNELARLSMNEINRAQNEPKQLLADSKLGSFNVLEGSIMVSAAGDQVLLKYGQNANLHTLPVPPPSPAQETNSSNVVAIRTPTLGVIGSSQTPALSFNVSGGNPATLASQLIAGTLKFDFVYILYLKPNDKSVTGPPLVEVLGEWGMPDPPPTFDPTVHTRALQSEAGFIYRNPRLGLSQDDVFQIGMMIPLWRDSASQGAVLAGYAKSSRGRKGSNLLTLATTKTFLEFHEDEIRYMQEWGSLKDVFFPKDATASPYPC